MDVGAFVQENKRWLLGSALGLLVYWIASGVIASSFDVAGVRAKAMKASKLPQGSDELYRQEERDAARQEQQALQQQLAALRQELEFRPDPAYLLQGQTVTADDYLTKVGRELRERLQKEAEARDVQLADKALTWPALTDPDGVRGVLFGLDLLAEATARLFLAHDEVRAADELAPGLIAIPMLSVVDNKSRPQPGLRQPRGGAVDPRELLEEQKVDFHFQCDAPTAYLFLERCRVPGKALVLENLSVVQGQKPGEPMTVKGSIRGIAFKEGKQ